MFEENNQQTAQIGGGLGSMGATKAAAPMSLTEEAIGILQKNHDNPMKMLNFLESIVGAQ